MVEQDNREGQIKDRERTMNWHRSQIVYEVFVDRFNRGPRFEEKSEEGLYSRDGGMTRKWDGLPNRRSHGMEFFGGDLEGITEKLDYIKEMHANVLYLTPIFRAATNHKYDTHEFEIDPQFGDEETLKKLFEEAKKRDIRVILDGVFNHVGVDGKWFNRAKRYGDGGAYNDPDSPFAKYFDFSEWPERYRSWLDVPLLPELNLDNEELRDRLFKNDDSVVKRYLKMGASGWRIDCAHDLGHEINSMIVAASIEARKDSCVVGEALAYPVEWFGKSKLTGVMNYYFTNLVLNTLNGRYSPALLRAELDMMVEKNGIESLSTSWNMLSSHDMPRMNTTLRGDSDLKKMAVALQIAYPGNPLLYYGEENGMNGGEDPDNRRPMVWNEDRWDWTFREYVEKAMLLKSTEPALNGGQYLKVNFNPDSDVIGFGRHTGNPADTLFFFANFSDEPAVERVPVPYSYFMHHTRLETIFGEGSAIARISEIEAELPPKSAAFFKFKPSFSGYRLYKGV